MGEREIVVGMDGSPAAAAALRWAVQEAALRSCPVRAVGVVDVRIDPSMPMVEPIKDDLLGRMSAVLEQALAQVRAEYPGVALHQEVTAASPAEYLVQLGRTAELLVVGRRGHSALAGLLMGSVALQVSAHAECPVVVVRDVG